MQEEEEEEYSAIREGILNFHNRWYFFGLHSENTGLDFPPKWLYIDRIQKITLGLTKTGLPSQKFHLEALFHRWNTLVVVCTCVCTWQSWQGLERWPWQEPGRGRSPILSMRTSLSIWYMDKMVIFLSVIKLSRIFFNVICSTSYYWCQPQLRPIDKISILYIAWK